MSAPNYEYITNIPNPPHIPAIDVPNMYINTNSINNIWTSDHVGFNTTGSGYHNQVTFFSENTPSTPTDPTSVLYTATGGASSTAELFYQNAQANFLVSGLKAWGSFANTGTPTQFANSWNCATLSIAVTSGRSTATITFNSGVINGSNLVAIVQCTTPSFIANYAYNPSNGQFTITYTNTPAATIEFVIFQH